MNTWLLTSVAAFLIAILSGLGVGSAGLFVLYLTSVAGLTQTQAQGLNLVFFLASAGVSLVLHRKKRKISLPLVVYLLAFAIPGVWVGTYILRQLDAATVRHLFGWMLVIAGTAALVREIRQTRKAESQPSGENTPS